MNPKVIFITGSSGSGKTTVSKKVCQNSDYELHSIDDIRDDCAGDTALAWMRVWSAIQGGRLVLVDSTGASPFFHIIRRLCAHSQIQTIVVKLSTRTENAWAPDETRRRASIKLSRGQPSASYIEASIRSLDVDVLFDTTEFSADFVATAIMEKVNRTVNSV